MKPSARRKARSLALQALYQWHFNADSGETLASQFLAGCNPKKVDTEYFKKILLGTIANGAKIDQHISMHLDRKINAINPIELAILRLATYELVYSTDIPHKVIINEALEITKIFGAEEGFKYINGVLDKVAKDVRSRHTAA